MRLVQVEASDRVARLGLVEGERVLVLVRPHESVATSLDLLIAASARAVDAAGWRESALGARAFEEIGQADLAAGRTGWRLTVPLTPSEVWGAGVTYRRSADFREEGTGIYDRVYVADRPELFFKATAARCAGPGQPIGRRRDSSFTASEPELAIVLAATGSILGFTLANDVSAWDIERENPLYLPQSKVYDGCFSFGPSVVTPDEIPDPYALELRCRVARGSREVFAGSASTAQLKRRFPELVEWLRRSNAIPDGTVLSTGTGIIQPMDAGLEEGDVVTISCPEIGELVNPVTTV
jgi:2-dehydro-3-deoxy-D-arabinonate dehydratase